MSWFKNLFGFEKYAGPRTYSAGRNADLESAVACARTILAELIRGYGEASVMVREHRSYLKTLERELSASSAV